MAVFGKNAQEGLQFTISERGADETAGKFNRLASSADRVARASGTGAAAGIGRLRQGLSGLRNVANNLIGTFAKVGGLLGLGGGFAIAGLLKEQVEVERSLSRIAFQGNRSAAQMARMRDTMNQVSGATGKTRAEVLAAIDASTDFGLSWEQAEAKIQQIVLWSDLMGVSADEASAAVASMNRAMGGNANIDQMMSMLDAAARGSGFKSEGAFFQTVAKVMPQMEGMEDVGDINTFMQAIAGMGEELGTDPRMIVSGIKSLNKSLGDPKMQKSFERFGITGDNASEVLISMAQRLAGDAHALDKAGLPDEVLFMARTMADNLGPMRDMGAAVDTAAGKAEEFAARVAEHAKDPEIAWAGTMERLKQVMEPIVTGVLDWFVQNNDKLVAAFEALKGTVEQVSGAIGAAVDYIRNLLGLGDAPVDVGVNITDEEQARSIYEQLRLRQAQGQEVGTTSQGIITAYERQNPGAAAEVTRNLPGMLAQNPMDISPGAAQTDMRRLIERMGRNSDIQVTVSNRTDQDVRVRRNGETAEAVAPAGG